MKKQNPVIYNETEELKEIINSIRKEANEVKECFTKISFQTIAASVPILGFIAKYHNDFTFVAVTSLAHIIFLFAVARIGNHKYATANRNYGYELHIQRTKPETSRIPTDFHRDICQSGWKDYMRNIGWEEALRAWRVVQATVFEHFYEKGTFKCNKLKKDFRDKENLWFEPFMNMGNNATYHAGSYLKSIHFIFYALAGITFLLVLLAAFKNFQTQQSNILKLTIFLFCLILLTYMVISIMKTDARRRLLEEGILSIHSCATMWQLLIIAHFRAINNCKKKSSKTHSCTYPKELIEQADKLKISALNIDEWINEKS